MRKNETLKQVARGFGITKKEAEKEMMLAIKAGRENPDPEVQALWNNMFGDKTPTLEEFIKVTSRCCKK